MSSDGTLNFFWAITGIGDGKPFQDQGSFTVPVKEITLPLGFQLCYPKVVPKQNDADPQPDPTSLWKYTQGDTFELLLVQIRGGAGYLKLAWLLDKPTDPVTNRTPLGTYRSVQRAELSCHAPFILNSDAARVWVTASAGTRAGLDGDGFPDCLTTATASAEGMVVEVWATNPALSTDADGDVTVDVFVAR